MAFQDVGPEQAIFGGAWGLLCWVRTSDKNQSEFFKNLLSRILPSRSDQGRSVPLGQGKTVSQAVIDRLLGYGDGEDTENGRAGG